LDTTSCPVTTRAGVRWGLGAAVRPGQDGLQKLQGARRSPKEDDGLVGVGDASRDVGGQPLDGGGGPVDGGAWENRGPSVWRKGRPGSCQEVIFPRRMPAREAQSRTRGRGLTIATPTPANTSVSAVLGWPQVPSVHFLTRPGGNEKKS